MEYRITIVIVVVETRLIDAIRIGGDLCSIFFLLLLQLWETCLSGITIQIVHFTRNVGMKGLSWKVEIGRRRNTKNFGRRILEEKWNGSARKFFSSSIVGDLSIWDYNSNCVFYEERKNERVELKG